MKYAVCTSFSRAGYELYGKRFLEAFTDDWPPSVPIFLYSEDSINLDEISLCHGSSAIYSLDLNSQPDYVEFLDNTPPPCGNYRFDAGRFCHKLFAITDPNRPPDLDWWIWLDADTETFSPVDNAFLESVCPPHVTGSYLGRKDWNHSECGWVAYNLKNGGSEFLARFRSLYVSGEIYEHMEWHDSYLFDRVREEFPEQDWLNLSESASGLDVWEQTILGTKMRHFKGPQAKQALAAERERAPP